MLQVVIAVLLVAGALGQPNCTEDFLEDLLVIRYVNEKKFGPGYENKSTVGNETLIHAIKGTLPILCPGDLDFPNLFFLFLEKVGLEDIQPGSFAEVPELKELNLARNQLTEIENGIFSNTNLVVVNLEGNQITNIEEDAFDNMPYLMAVDLEYNHLTTINPNWFENCNILTSVMLNHNDIEVVPERAFRFLKEYDGLKVHLMYNKVTKLEPEAFWNLEKHGEILLDHNFLEEIPSNILPNSSHSFTLRLSGNRLECLPDKILHDIALSSKVIDLRDNPFREECLEDLESYVEENKEVCEVLL